MVTSKTARKKPGPKPKNGNGEAPDATTPPAASKPAFKFELHALVAIRQSNEQGTVRARAEWATGNVSYYLAYTSKAGEYKEAWID